MKPIETTLEKLHFVKWDRYINIRNGYVIFGWIEREHDSYKDFVSIEFDGIGDVVIWNTSSKEYSEIMSKLLNTTHTDCHRVENRFDIKNCIRLE